MTSPAFLLAPDNPITSSIYAHVQLLVFNVMTDIIVRIVLSHSVFVKRIATWKYIDALE